MQEQGSKNRTGPVNVALIMVFLSKKNNGNRAAIQQSDHILSKFGHLRNDTSPTQNYGHGGWHSENM